MSDPNSQPPESMDDVEKEDVRDSNIHLLRWLLYWGILLLLLLLFVVPLLITPVLLDKITPARWVSVVFPSIGAALLFSIGVLSIGSRKLRRLGKPRSPSPTGRQLLAIVVTVVLISLAIWLGLRFHMSAEDRALLDRAQQHFSAIVHGTISTGRVESILIELEGEYERLHKRYALPTYRSLVEVNLYSNVTEFQLSTGRPSKALGFTTCLLHGPVIYLPVDEKGGKSLDQYSYSTPEHEMVHAVICDLAGRQQAYSIPLWFHEGLAECESLKGLSNIWERLDSRWYLWRHKSETMPVEAFLSTTSPYPGEEETIFYISSFEFMRYITNRFGEQIPWNILKKVAEGETFDTAFKHMTNYDSTYEYEEWLRTY